MERKQYRLVIPYAITVHKSQGSTLIFMVGDLECATDKGSNAASVNSALMFIHYLPVQHHKARLNSLILSQNM